MDHVNWKLIDVKEAYWEVGATKDLSAFLRAIPLLDVQSAVMYFESGDPDEEIKDFFNKNGIPGEFIPMGSADPFPNFHLPITEGNIETLAEIADRHSEFEIAAHIHIYSGETILLQWYDAFWDPILVSTVIEKENIDKFSKKLGVKYGLSTTRK